MGDKNPHAAAGNTNTQANILTTTATSSAPRRRPVRFQARTLLLPLGVLTLGALFFVYSRTSIQAAKENAKRAREADGGKINWRNESLRRHGVLEKPQERTLWQQLLNGDDVDDATKERRAKENRRLEMQGREMRQANPIEDDLKEESKKQDRLLLSKIAPAPERQLKLASNAHGRIYNPLPMGNMVCGAETFEEYAQYEREKFAMQGQNGREHIFTRRRLTY